MALYQFVGFLTNLNRIKGMRPSLQAKEGLTHRSFHLLQPPPKPLYNSPQLALATQVTPLVEELGILCGGGCCGSGLMDALTPTKFHPSHRYVP